MTHGRPEPNTTGMSHDSFGSSGTVTDTSGLGACHCCGLVQRLPVARRGWQVRCVRCRTLLVDPVGRARHEQRALAAALAALLLYPLAIGLPILRMEKLGLASEASIWEGSVGLLRHGEYFVGAVVLLCSVVLPLVKLLAIVTLTAGRRLLSSRHRALTYRLIEGAGRWGMLDVLLIAMVVAWIKMGDLVQVSRGPAALAFTLCVLFSLLAGAWFDPHAIWENPRSSGSTAHSPLPPSEG